MLSLLHCSWEALTPTLALCCRDAWSLSVARHTDLDSLTTLLLFFFFLVFSSVHGFDNVTYNVTEGNRLDFVFQLNIKGTTNLPSLQLNGMIEASPAGTASELYIMSHFGLFHLKIISLHRYK